MKNKTIILSTIIFLTIISIISITEGKQEKMQNIENTEIKNNVISLNDENFNDIVIKSSKPVVVDFWAPWCGPCKRLSPIIDELADEYEGKITFAKLNVDENEKLSAEYQITSIPRLIIFKNGTAASHIIGLHTKSEIEEILNPVLK